MRCHYLVAGCLGLSVLLGGCGTGTPRIAAKVERVERRCDYTETSYRRYGSGKESVTGKRERHYDCSDDPKFLAIQSGRTPNVRLSGDATAIVRYTSPVDHNEHQAWIKVDASDKAFYSLRTGQLLEVQLDPQDGSKAYL